MIGDVLRSLAAGLVSVGHKDGGGTGIVIGNDERTTTILTCAHVVGNNDSIMVTSRRETNSGYRFKNNKAKVVYRNDAFDLALVGTLRPLNMPVINLSQADPGLYAPIFVGGHPNDLHGICAPATLVGVPGSYGGATDDSYVYQGFSFPGSSGGALVNLDCELIGVVKSISRDEEVLLTGIGFATPLSDIKKFLRESTKDAKAKKRSK